MIVSFHRLPPSVVLPCEMPDCARDATVGLHESARLGCDCTVFYHCQQCAERIIREQDKDCAK